jgi:mono/diheme cytochrome c family protein
VRYSAFLVQAHRAARPILHIRPPPSATMPPDMRMALLLVGIASTAFGQGWNVPPGGRSAKSPLSPTPAVVKRGSALYTANCARCHGPEGKGDGPDKTNDPAHPPADLTNPFQDRVPDGFLFYAIWNGREQPTMPAFKTKLTKTDVWSVIAYIKTLRRRTN